MPRRPKGEKEEDGTAAGVPRASLPPRSIPTSQVSTMHDVGFSSKTFVSVPATAVSSPTLTTRLDYN